METVGHWQNRNFDITDPAKVAIAATKAWRDSENAAQALHGVPADRLLRLPQPGDEVATKAFHQKLGVPVDVAGYDFSTVKHANGDAVDPAFAGSLAQTFIKVGVPKEAATEIARQIVGLADAADTTEAAENTAKAQIEVAKLQTNWGQNYAANRVVAQQGAAKLGITEAELNLMDGQLGHARVMEMFRQIGSQLGEATFQGGGANGTPGVLTQEQAVARIADLKKDTDWVKKYMSGDTAAQREMANLQRVKLGGIDNTNVNGIPLNRR